MAPGMQIDKTINEVYAAHNQYGFGLANDFYTEMKRMKLSMGMRCALEKRVRPIWDVLKEASEAPPGMPTYRRQEASSRLTT